MNPITWSEFKEKMEMVGAKDHDLLCVASIDADTELSDLVFKRVLTTDNITRIDIMAALRRK